MVYETNCTEITQDKPRFKSRRDRQSFLCPQHCHVDFEKGTLTIPKAKDIFCRTAPQVQGYGEDRYHQHDTFGKILCFRIG